MQSAMIGVFVWLLGLAVGSFLNVVIYRMPLGISLSQPRWSFCPHCGNTIRWFDNLPVIGWLLLRGRCRSCRTNISVQYPLIEAITALMFMLIWFLLTQLSSRVGLEAFSIARDWPCLLAWLVLTACLIAVAAMDIVSYALDIRVTEFAVLVGCVLHAVWARPEFHLPVATGPAAPAATAAFIVMLFLIAATVWRQQEHQTAPAGDQEPFHQIGEPHPQQSPASPATSRLALAGIVVLVSCSVLILLAPFLRGQSGLQRVLEVLPPAALGLVFMVMVLAASLRRQADELVHAAVEAEAPHARRVALGELRWLLPIILAGAGAFAIVQYIGPDGWNRVVEWAPFAERKVLAGLVYAMHGTIVAAGVGWALRLVFTLIFGREAFGTGDIYILGATGAVAGWDIALLALTISIALAMASWLISQFMKSTLMIPFGPPLALGVAFALWLDRSAHALAGFYMESLANTAREQPRLLVVLGGVMLIGFAASLLAARAVRRAIEPDRAG